MGSIKTQYDTVGYTLKEAEARRHIDRAEKMLHRVHVQQYQILVVS